MYPSSMFVVGEAEGIPVHLHQREIDLASRFKISHAVRIWRISLNVRLV